MPRSAKGASNAVRVYAPVVVGSTGDYRCPAPGCSFSHTVYRQVYNHYVFASRRRNPTGHVGLLCPAKGLKRHSTQITPTHSQGCRSEDKSTDAAELAQSISQDSCSSNTEESVDADFNALEPQFLSALSSVQIHKLHSLPSQCKCSILIHGHLQGIVSLEKLHAAAADCYSGTEAWLDASTVSTIKSKAVLSLHPDKNQNLPPSYCNNLFAQFHQRVDDLLHSTDDTVFWTSLVNESVAAVAYLSFCHGQATPNTC